MDIKYLSFLDTYRDVLGNPKGIDVQLIQKIEIDFNVRLPRAYKEYLFLFGENTGNLLSSYLTSVYKLKGNRESAKNAAIDELSGKAVNIKDSFFFFGQWQGYVFYFFDCEEGKDDPTIYILTDSPGIEKYKDSFTLFVRDEGLNPLLEG